MNATMKQIQTDLKNEMKEKLNEVMNVAPWTTLILERKKQSD